MLLQELRDALQNKDTHTDEMTELQEAVEMATLDKEMAEEKVVTLNNIFFKQLLLIFVNLSAKG